jgi:hypothetical protein
MRSLITALSGLHPPGRISHKRPQRLMVLRPVPGRVLIENMFENQCQISDGEWDLKRLGVLDLCCSPTHQLSVSVYFTKN